MKCIFCFHDIASDIFINPFIADNSNDAIRAVSQLVNKPGNNMADFPQDFVLYQSGTISFEDGRLIPIPDPILIVPIIKLKKGPANEKA